MNKQELISLAKEKGFISAYFEAELSWGRDIYTPSDLIWLFWLTELQRWLREKHDLHVCIETYNQDEEGNDIEYTYSYGIVTRIDYPFVEIPNTFHKTYEEALEEGLKQALKLIEPS